MSATPATSSGSSTATSPSWAPTSRAPPATSLERLLSAGGELVTLVTGADAEPGLAERVAAALGRDRPEVEVVVIDGGQPVYPLLVGVE